MINTDSYIEVVESLKKAGFGLGTTDERFQQEMLKAVILLARQMKEYGEDLLKRDKLHVLIAGCDWSETQLHGKAYHALNHLLGTDIKWHIVLVGKEAQSALARNISSFVKLPTSFSDDRVTVTINSNLLAEEIDEFGLPDVLILNHAGFESFHKNWLEEDDGIAECIREGVPVFGASYAMDESEIDDFCLRAYGLKVDDVRRNPLIVDRSQDVGAYQGAPEAAIKALEDGMCNWGESIWVMKSNGLHKDFERLEILEDMDTVLESVSMYLMHKDLITFPNEVASNLVYKDETGDLFVRVYGNYSYSFKEGCIFDEESGVIADDDVEWDSSYIKMSKLDKPFHAMCLATSIFQHNIKDNIEQESTKTQEPLSESMSEMDLLSAMGVEVDTITKAVDLLEAYRASGYDAEAIGVTEQDIAAARNVVEFILSGGDEPN